MLEIILLNGGRIEWIVNLKEYEVDNEEEGKNPLVQKIYILRAAETECVDTSIKIHAIPRTSLPRLHASAGLVGTPACCTCTAVSVAFPYLPTQGCLGSLPPSAWSSCPFRYSLKLQRSSRDLILIPFFSSPLSILFLFPLPVHLVYPRCISPSDYSRVVLPFLPLYRFRLLTSQPWLPE